MSPAKCAIFALLLTWWGVVSGTVAAVLGAHTPAACLWAGCGGCS